jgi:hypothetical protein
MIQYGAVTVLAGFLLAVVFGFLKTPLLSQDKDIETATYNGVTRNEASLATMMMRLDVLGGQFAEIRDALDRQTCVNLMSPQDKDLARRPSPKDLTNSAGGPRRWPAVMP